MRASKTTTVNDGTPECVNIIHRHHSNRNVLTRTSAKSHEIVLQGHTSTNWSQSWVLITFVLLLSKYKEWEWKKEHMNESERIILCICFRWILQICYSHALTCNHKWASHVCRWKLLKVKGILNSRCNFQTPPWKAPQELLHAAKDLNLQMFTHTSSCSENSESEHGDYSHEWALRAQGL